MVLGDAPLEPLLRSRRSGRGPRGSRSRRMMLYVIARYGSIIMHYIIISYYMFVFGEVLHIRSHSAMCHISVCVRLCITHPSAFGDAPEEPGVVAEAGAVLEALDHVGVRQRGHLPPQQLHVHLRAQSFQRSDSVAPHNVVFAAATRLPPPQPCPRATKPHRFHHRHHRHRQHHHHVAAGPAPSRPLRPCPRVGVEDMAGASAPAAAPRSRPRVETPAGSEMPAGSAVVGEQGGEKRAAGRAAPGVDEAGACAREPARAVPPRTAFDEQGRACAGRAASHGVQ